jgi:hypothetical protein
MKKDLLKGLTEEQIAKVKECKSLEEIVAIAKQEGIQLTDEQLQAVNGGGCNSAEKPTHCPRCNSTNIRVESMKHEMSFSDYYYKCKCKDCYYKWEAE